MNPSEGRKRIRNPREVANIFSFLSFAYTQELFKKGYSQDLEDDDIYEVTRSCRSQRCGDKLEKQWAYENKQDTPASIYKLMWHRYGLRYIFVGCVDLVVKVSNSIILPYSSSIFISYFKPGQTEVSDSDAHFHAYCVMAIFIFYCFYSHNYTLWVEQFALEIRTAFSSLLYRKALKLTPSALSQISLGNIVTLITKDVYNFQESIFTINDTWNGMVQTVIICYILYSQIGVVTFIGIGILISTIPIQIIIGKYISILRLANSKRTDQRLQLTQETLSTIRIIKMYTWEKFFGEMISSARKSEMNKMLYTFYLKIITVTVGIMFSRFGFYALIISYIWMGYSTDTEMIFYMITLFKDLEYNLGTLIPWGMAQAADLYASVVRINRVLVAEELQHIEGTYEKMSDPFVEMENSTVHINSHEILKDISFRAESGLTVITGNVGSGKSSFLKAILQDYPLTSGKVVSRGRISYASQDAWLFPSTIRQNIVFNEKYNEQRYTEIVRICALEYDYNLFEEGDQTIVKDRGMNLSGGQQARINLARAIYRDSEIYLLDDSLTALDPHVQDYIFEECIKKFLANKIVIMVSQTAHHIKEADHVIVLNNGRIRSCGKPSKELLQEVTDNVIPDTEHGEESKLEKKKTELNDADEEVEDDTPLKRGNEEEEKTIYKEVKKTGSVDYKTYLNYFYYGGGILLMVLNVIIFGLAQGTESYSDMLLTQWVDDKEKVLSIEKNLTKMYGQNFTSELPENSTEIETLNDAISIEQIRVHFYSIMIFVSTAAVLIKIYVLLSYCRRASINIHKSMLASILSAPMAFFDTHFIGNILNRFSQDMNNVDELLPFVFTEVFRVFFIVCGIMYIIISVHWSFLVHFCVFFAFLIILRIIYMPTGRSLKRLEAATRSPMIGHLNATLEGLTTLRACGAQDILINEFDRHQDLFTSAYFTGLTTSIAFSFVMDFCCTLFIISVVGRFAFFDSGASVGDVGLAVTQVFMLSGEVDWGIKQWADLENLMTSVERILEYTDLDRETKEGKQEENWPKEGKLSFENVSLSYNNKETVLKNITFNLNPKEKLGIVGRTGAGKSSIILSLFRLYQCEGRIIIDDVDLKTLSLQFLRQKLAIIPQDPILFSGTIRTNLDPFGDFKDDELWKVLDKVNLKNSISNLNMITSSSHSTFSSGEKQLICLARAILREAKIVILDEATANMDQETDALLNKCIKENFSDCTVLTIAHRLQSILESDKVMVLDKGNLKEFDSPEVLLSNEGGYFYKMVQQAGLLKDK